MKICRDPQKPAVHAFTVLELAVVVLIVGLVFGFVVMPGTMPRGVSSEKRAMVACINNLKNVGLGFCIFSTDNQDQFPFVVPVSKGGTLEWRSNAVVLPHIKAITNGLPSPQVLFCPADKERKPAKDFASLTEQNISYFLNLSAAENPQSILAGDRMLMTNGVRLRNQFLKITPGLRLQVAPKSHPYGINAVLGDGSVQQLSLARLQEQVTYSILGTNGPERWVFP